MEPRQFDDEALERVDQLWSPVVRLMRRSGC
jgi:hypothetical protein